MAHAVTLPSQYTRGAYTNLSYTRSLIVSTHLHHVESTHEHTRADRLYLGAHLHPYTVTSASALALAGIRPAARGYDRLGGDTRQCEATTARGDTGTALVDPRSWRLAIGRGASHDRRLRGRGERSGLSYCCRDPRLRGTRRHPSRPAVAGQGHVLRIVCRLKDGLCVEEAGGRPAVENVRVPVEHIRDHAQAVCGNCSRSEASTGVASSDLTQSLRHSSAASCVRDPLDFRGRVSPCRPALRRPSLRLLPPA